MTSLQNATIHFNAEGTPVADDFDDVYFSNDDGLKESDYVFFQSNHIAERLAQHPYPQFTVAETGFGTGLNFLNTWQRFEEHNYAKPLHFISFEKFPIDKADLEKALAAWPTLKTFSQQLLAQYPDAVPGCHRLVFAGGKVTLDLWLGDIHAMLPELSPYPHVDAWYLDGFAPSKNPDMWQQTVFDAMSRYGRKGCTFATFTAAGFVRRGLIAAGFDAQKQKGYGRKREMVIGQLASNKALPVEAFNAQPKRSLDNVAIIGGGIASASIAVALAKRGLSFSLFCQDDALAKGASKHHQGAVYPQLHAEYTPYAALYATSFYFAKNLYQHLDTHGFHYAHDWCGVLLQAISEPLAVRFNKLINNGVWPKALICDVDAKEASQLANLPLPYAGLFMAKAGWVSPRELVTAMFKYSDSLCQHSYHFNTQVTRIEQTTAGYCLYQGQQKLGEFSDVFLTTGHLLSELTGEGTYPIKGVRGQVSHLKASDASSALGTVLCHKGYFTPAYQGIHAMGATFDKVNVTDGVTDDDNDKNLAQLAGFYQDTDWFKAWQGKEDITGAKVGVRATLPDHMPLVGSLCDKQGFLRTFADLSKGKMHGFKDTQLFEQGLHTLSGFGARGLCSAPLCAEVLISQLLQEPMPMAKSLRNAILPQRFWVKGLIRKEIAAD